MRFLYGAICIALSCNLVSCKWDEESLSKERLREGEPQKYEFREVLLSKKISTTTDVGYVQAGDYLKIELTGQKFIPLFSDVFHKYSTSTWKVKRCERDAPDWRFKSLAKQISYCRWKTRKGKCISNFRSFNGEIEEDLYFENLEQDLKLQYRIGDKAFHLGEILKQESNTITFGVLISESMLTSSNELKIQVLQPDDKKIKTGFLSHHSCKGINKKSFNPHISRTSAMESTSPRYEYEVNLYTGILK